jgi:hypothetical protein
MADQLAKYYTVAVFLSVSLSNLIFLLLVPPDKVLKNLDNLEYNKDRKTL